MKISMSVRHIVLSAFLAAAVGGCDSAWNPGNWFRKSGRPRPTTAPAPRLHARVAVPRPVSLLLPKSIRIVHPFTETRTFDEAGGVKGIDASVEVFDHFHRSTMAFGDFRFELYSFRDNSLDPKRKLKSVWEIEPSMMDPRENLRYWNRSQQMYEFKLQWGKPIPVGQKFVLAAVFTSPFTDRLIAERVFTSGE